MLNALGIDRPATLAYPEYVYFTQQDFFAKVEPRLAVGATVDREGMTLAQLGEVLKGFGVLVTVQPADALNVDQFRQLLRDRLGAGAGFMLMNYNRKLMGEMGGGHWSPLAAYHPGSDTVLILDGARYKYPPVWVPVATLLEAGQLPDSGSGKSRGLLIVRRP